MGKKRIDKDEKRKKKKDIEKEMREEETVEREGIKMLMKRGNKE